MDPVGLRLQSLALRHQVLALSRLAQTRSDSGLFAVADIDDLFDRIGLPPPSRTRDTVNSLIRDKALVRDRRTAPPANLKLSPRGLAQAQQLASDMDLRAAVLEARSSAVATLGETPHPEIPPSLAPPDLILPLRRFFDEFPFETNAFAMTRFPDPKEKQKLDPIADAIEAARGACQHRGLHLHLASDRKIMPEVWSNVAAHMWGCRYGIAFIEEHTEKGINLNMSIEVGSCLALGRRLALLRDETVKNMPSDLVGHIYHPLDLTRPNSVTDQIDKWLDSLNDA
jgi:hypothetical protein